MTSASRERDHHHQQQQKCRQPVIRMQNQEPPAHCRRTSAPRPREYSPLFPRHEEGRLHLIRMSMFHHMQQEETFAWERRRRRWSSDTRETHSHPRYRCEGAVECTLWLGKSRSSVLPPDSERRGERRRRAIVFRLSCQDKIGHMREHGNTARVCNRHRVGLHNRCPESSNKIG